jgi:hypothetical protein
MMKTLLRGIGMVAVMIAAGAALSVAPASASTDTAQLLTCTGSGCLGKNPMLYTCSQDAQTVRSASREGATIQLRYSPSCRSAWAREVNGRVGDFLWVRNPREQETTHITSGTSAFTLMVSDSGVTAAACMTLLGETVFTCTGSF